MFYISFFFHQIIIIIEPCQCTAEYGLTTDFGEPVEANCDKLSRTDNSWCYLTGGPKGKECQGAVKSGYGDFYWTEDDRICRSAEWKKQSSEEIFNEYITQNYGMSINLPPYLSTYLPTYLTAFYLTTYMHTYLPIY